MPYVEYQNLCYDNDLLTAKLRVPSQTADTMAKFIAVIDLEDEPHTALEDARDYENMILARILEDTTKKQLMRLGK